MTTKNEPKKDQEQKKSAPRGEKVSTSFKNTIKAYLDKAIKSIDGWLALRQEKESNPFLPDFEDKIINGLR